LALDDVDIKWHRNFNASQRRAALKSRAVEYKGGKCVICSYDNPCALQFHHEDPRTKEFEVSSKMSWEVIKPELDKCVLVCANCHIEIHAGFHPEYLISIEESYEDW